MLMMCYKESQRCTLSPNLFKVYINYMIVAVEAVKKRVKVCRDWCLGIISWKYQKHLKDCSNK